jgi:GNAT superfamily N-acetyltransferase
MTAPAESRPGGHDADHDAGQDPGQDPAALVLRFASSTGSPKDAEFYLSLFRAERPESFAIIAVAEAVMRDAADAIITDLRFLARLGLVPVIQLGVIDPGDAERHAHWIAERLRPDVRAQVTAPGEARNLARAGVMPLIPAGAGYGSTHRDSENPRAVTDARFSALAELATSLATRKIIFVGKSSGLQPKNGPIPSLVDVSSEYEALRPVLPADEAELLRQTRRLIDTIAHRVTISVTSPLDLLRELFTMRGAGTLLRRGSAIARFSRCQDVDLERARAVIESAFGRGLVPDFFAQPVSALYVADEYRGLAVVQDTPHGSYLSKFAVERRAQGEGVGRDLWRALIRDHARLLWRGRADNPITAWYQQHCDGMMRLGEWHVFWRGLPVPSLPAAIEFAASARPDLVSEPRT